MLSRGPQRFASSLVIPGGDHEVAKVVPFLGENLNLTASFNHQRAVKIVIPQVVKNLLSDSDFPPKMVPTISRYETTYCCLLVPWSLVSSFLASLADRPVEILSLEIIGIFEVCSVL